ncbi:unnamed protein product [Calypogeia fissa]
MSLAHFVGLDSGYPAGNFGEMEEFLTNYKKEESIRVNNRNLDLSQKRLALIFKLGEPKERKASQRAKQWHSKKFSGPKEKNDYGWSQCTDREMVERYQLSVTDD